MAKHSDEMTRCLIECDTAGVRRLWKYIAPHLPQPTSDREALISIHMSRTQMDCLNLRLRAYSHRWLIDNGYPSQLPDRLKPRAERMYPRIVEACGIAVVGRSALGRQVAPIIQRAMMDAAEDCFANGDREPAVLGAHIQQARKDAIRKLLGK